MKLYKYEVSGTKRDGTSFAYLFVNQNIAFELFEDLKMGKYIRVKIRELSISEALRIQRES